MTPVDQVCALSSCASISNQHRHAHRGSGASDQLTQDRTGALGPVQRLCIVDDDGDRVDEKLIALGEERPHPVRGAEVSCTPSPASATTSEDPGAASLTGRAIEPRSLLA